MIRAKKLTATIASDNRATRRPVRRIRTGSRRSAGKIAIAGEKSAGQKGGSEVYRSKTPDRNVRRRENDEILERCELVDLVRLDAGDADPERPHDAAARHCVGEGHSGCASGTSMNQMVRGKHAGADHDPAGSQRADTREKFAVKAAATARI